MLGLVPNMVNDLLERRGKISMLESMALNTSKTFSVRKPQERAFAVAPRLTELKLKHYGRNSGWVFPWSQLW